MRHFKAYISQDKKALIIQVYDPIGFRTNYYTITLSSLKELLNGKKDEVKVRRVYPPC